MAGGELEVDRTVGVGMDHPMIAPMVEGVFDPNLAGLGHDGSACGIACGDQPRFGGLLIASCNDNMAIVRGRSDAQEHSVVELFVDEHIGAPPRGTAKDLGGSSVFIAPDPEQPLAVGRKGQGAVAALYGCSQLLAVDQVFHEDRVIFRALLIGRPGIEGVVGTVGGAPDLKKGLVLGERLLIKQDLLMGFLAAGAADVDGVLSAAFVPDVVLPGSVWRGNRGVVFLDPPFHLRKHLRLQRLGVAEHGLCVSVLGDQVFAHVGSQRLWVAQDLLPVVVLHPGIVIDPYAPQLLNALRTFWGDGGLKLSHGVLDALCDGRPQGAAWSLAADRRRASLRRAYRTPCYLGGNLPVIHYPLTPVAA